MGILFEREDDGQLLELLTGEEEQAFIEECRQELEDRLRLARLTNPNPEPHVFKEIRLEGI